MAVNGLGSPAALLAGIAAPVLYVAAVVAGGWLTPEYSHVADPISALIMTGAPAAGLLIATFAVYNVLIGIFALGLRQTLRAMTVPASGLSAAFLVATAVAGAAMLWFPMDAIGAPPTATGMAHVVLAGVASLGSMLAILAAALGMRTHSDGRRLAAYSFLSLLVVFVSGALAAVAAARTSPFMGLAERVTIGAFLQWVLVLAIARVAS